MKRALVAAALLVPGIARADPFVIPRIAEFDFRKWRGVVLEEGDRAWERIPWRTHFWTASAEAQRRGVPILLFADHPRPLGPGVPGGIRAREVWAHPEVRQLALLYVAVADDTGALREAEGPEGERFRKILSDAQGRGGEGIYLVAPSGVFLGAVTPDGPAAVVAALEEGLRRWNALSETNRLGKPVHPEDASPRPEDRFPEEGLALVAHSRVPADGRAGEWEHRRDAVWFTREEMLDLLPDEADTGARRDWPEELVRRLACFPALAGARMASVVTSATRTEVRFEIGGRVGGYVLSGRAVYGIRTGRFSSFELLALGDAYRDADVSGFYFTLAGPQAIDRLAPSKLEGYGWPGSEEE